MTVRVLRSDPSKISTTVKEAVVDSLVNLIHAQISGKGSTGRYLFGARPRTLLNSGFLLPQKQAEGDDEVTSPIWISSHGIQFQIAADISQIITVRPKIALYVRILPKEDDLRLPNCHASFSLRRNVVRELEVERNKRLAAAWDKVKDTYKFRSKYPDWPAIRERIVEEVYKEKGIPHQLITTVETEEPIGQIGDSGDDTPNQVVAASPTESAKIDDANFEPLVVPHKWMRLDILLPVLTLDTGKNLKELLADTATHTKLMNNVIAERLKAWAESDDLDIGGKLWGYRTKLKVPASQYKKWSDFLEFARKSTDPIALPKIWLDWDLQITNDWLDTTKRNLFIALENKSESPHQYVEETEDAVFAVSIQTEIPEKAHRALKLERIDPSYRFNKYLTYPAIGHNAGIKEIMTQNRTLLLETTWAPRYVQPRIVPTAVIGVERGVRALSRPDSLDGLIPIIPAMQAWLDELPSRINPSDGLDKDDIEGMAREIEAFKEDLKKWGAEKNAIQAGIDVLSKSREAWKSRGAQTNQKAVVYEAWLGMNEAMADFMKLNFRTDENQWRLFQLAFIVANIPALASRLPEFPRLLSGVSRRCGYIAVLRNRWGEIRSIFRITCF